MYTQEQLFLYKNNQRIVMEFDGKVAVVTGGGSGMDAATALRLARGRAAVVVADINRQGGADVADKIRAAGGQALFCATDVADPESVRSMVARAVTEFGHLDLAANVAGVP
jgi:NAD(P)-dependent dehydrogenase (short-subunit alcohol dehydrogenase family)